MLPSLIMTDLQGFGPTGALFLYISSCCLLSRLIPCGFSGLLLLLLKELLHPVYNSGKAKYSKDGTISSSN